MNVVRNPSAMAMSTSASNGSLPSSSAMSPTRRPAYAAVSGVNVSTMTWSCHLARWRMLVVPAACSARRARCCGSLSTRSFSSVDAFMIDAQPSNTSSTKPEWNEKRAFMSTGIVSPITLAPRAAAWSPSSSLARQESRFDAAGWMTFQFSGRFAVADIVIIRSATSSSNGPSPVAPWGSSSSDVPSYSPHTLASSMNSRRSANRDGTGLPSPSLCVSEVVVEKPKPPASRPSRRSRAICASSSSVAARSLAASPITTRRIAEWPTMNPALITRRPSSASR